jgi:hypothetical protein
VASWSLAGDRAAAAAAGTAPEPAGPGGSGLAGNDPGTSGETLRDAPDGRPMLRRNAAGLWCRVPADIVALRRAAPVEASRWRLAVRDVFRTAFTDGYVAIHCTRTSWYLLSPEKIR